jgi:hypothetical protein
VGIQLYKQGNHDAAIRLARLGQQNQTDVDLALRTNLSRVGNAKGSARGFEKAIELRPGFGRSIRLAYTRLNKLKGLSLSLF